MHHLSIVFSSLLFQEVITFVRSSGDSLPILGFDLLLALLLSPIRAYVAAELAGIWCLLAGCSSPRVGHESFLC